MTVHDAYEIQLINIRRRLDEGRLIRGHKVGLSSKAMQEMMGVDEPDYGHLLDDMFVFEGDVDTARCAAPGRGRGRLRPRATRFPPPAATPPTSCGQRLRGSRPWRSSTPGSLTGRSSLRDTIADNASSAGWSWGGRATPIDRSTCASSGPPLRRTGRIIATGNTGAVLGNPATAVAWLANKVHHFGVTLEAGT